MTKKPSLKIIPFGGCGEFGMNLTVYQYKEMTFVVDAGVIFPDPIKLGISSIIPDIAYFKSLFKKVDAYIITHGHEDHIGALPYFQKKMPAPIYATPWTVELIKSKFQQQNIYEQAEIHTVRAGDHVAFDEINFEYFHVNHSIPDSCSLIIRTKNETVFHTGDFRFDKNPPDGVKVNFDYLKALGKEGVDLLLADSTNAKNEGECLSESNVHKPLDKIIANAKGRVFLTTFASNFWRLRTIYRICQKRGKKLYLAGRSIDRTFDIAEKLNMFKRGQDVIIEDEHLKNYAEQDIVVLCTGSQGEYRAALARIANGEHRYFKVNEKDTLVFSSRVIPGNEKSIFHISSQFEKYGATVITSRDEPNIHTSGHAYQVDLKKLLSLLKPKNYLPVHGTHSHLMSNQRLAMNLIIDKDAGTPVENGDVLAVKGDQVSLVNTYDTQRMYVEADSYQTISHESLQERLKIGEHGLVIVTGIMDPISKKFSTGPHLSAYGLPEVKGHTYNDAKSSINRDLGRNRNDKQLTKEEITEIIRLSTRRVFSSHIKKKPVVIPQIIFQS